MDAVLSPAGDYSRGDHSRGRDYQTKGTEHAWGINNVYFKLTQHDHSIKCACPPGTKRQTRDLVKIRTGNTITWYHAHCRRLLNAMSEDFTVATKTALHCTESDTQVSHNTQALTAQKLASTLGPSATEKQLRKVRNLTSTFHCDGPCRGSVDHKDYFWCHLCYAWQHKPCMLFGEAEDRGRPVCNPCYIHAMMHVEEREKWQMRRLAQAGIEALRFIHDPKNKHETERRAFAIKFLGGLLSKNRKKFLQFVVNRRRVIRWIKARRGLPHPTYGNHTFVAPALVGSADPGTSANTPPSRSIREKRKIVKSEASVSAETGDGLSDLMQIDDVNGDSSFEHVDQGTLNVGKVKTERVTGKTRGTPALRGHKRKAITFEPLVAEHSAEDEVQNERMRKAAALKARNKAAAAARLSLLEVQGQEKPATVLNANAKIRSLQLMQNNEDNDGDFADIGIISNKEQQNLEQSRKQKSQPARKSAPSAGQSLVADITMNGNEDPQVAPSPKPQNKGKARQVVVDDRETDAPPQTYSRGNHRGAGDDEYQSAEAEILCSCVGVTSTANCYQCRRCRLYQHVACASRDSKTTFLCKLCVSSGEAVPPLPSTALTSTAVPTTEQLPASWEPEATLASSCVQPLAPVRFPTMAPMVPPSSSAAFRAPTESPATAAVRAPTATPHVAAAPTQRESLSESMQAEVRTLCRTILWDAYCDLPDQDDPDDRMALGKPRPPPPSDWLAEAERRVTIMFEAAGNDKVAEYLRHEFVQWPRNGLNIVKAMRDFAMWMRLKGPFRRARRELGLVAEILGFEDKGTYWKPDQKDDAKVEVKE